MNKTQLQTAYQKAVKIANQKLRRLERAGLQHSPAYRSMERGTQYKNTLKGNRFTAKGASKMKWQQLEKAYKEVQHFNKLETSGVRTTRGYYKEAESKLGITFENTDESKEFWNAIERMKEEYKADWYSMDKEIHGSFKVLQMAKEIWKENKGTDFFNTIKKVFEDITLEKGSLINYYNEVFSTSKKFDFESDDE